MFASIALAFFSTTASAQVSTTFDTDLDGWTISGDNTHFWNPVDGNPDGCLEVPDNASGPWSTALAPPKFLGNWRDMTESDSVSYDVLFLPTTESSGNPPAVFRISGPGGSARFNQVIEDSVWVHIAAPLDSTAWTVESGTWSDILLAVLQFEVAVEYRSGDETVRVDNIEIDGTPGDVYQVCASEDFEFNAPYWAGDGTASLSRPSSDGDIGGYLRVTSTGTGRVLPPITYLGDWSDLDGIGTIGFSFAYESGTIVAGRELRLELSGPGGAAHVSLPSDDYLDNPRVWHELQWTLEEGSWIVDSGTWAGLLLDVDEVAISVDFAVGTDTYGLDNVFRSGSGCDAVPVVPITIHEPGYTLCDRYPFRDGGALALNPADGELYGLVNGSTTASGGGGVYRLSGGPGRAVRMHTYSGAEGLVFTSDGDGFVSEDGSGDLYRFVGSDSSMLWVDGAVGFHPGDDDIAGLAIAPPGFSGINVSPGDILVTDWGNGGADEVWAVNPDTANGERLLVPDPGSANFWDIVGTPGGDVYLADDIQDNQLWSVASDGTLTPVPINSTIVNMQALAYDPQDDAIYTLRTSSPLGLYRIDLLSGNVTLVADGFRAFDTGNIEIDPVARELYVADELDNQIYTFCIGSVVGVEQPGPGPERLSLSMSPNPSTGDTRISFTLPHASSVRVDVIDVSGRRIRALANGRMVAGRHSLSWDGRDDSGRPAGSGIYFVRVLGDGFGETARAVRVR